VETNPQPHAPGDLALEVARAHASEEDTPLGVVSRALLRLAGDGERRFGLLVARQTWLEDTERIQREVYDLQPAGVPYLRDQAFADVIEIAEMLQCLPWKDSRDGTPGRNATASELEAARGELVDSVIFKGNQAVALGFTDDTLWPAVNQKAMVNVRKRQGLGKEVWG
jgi:hypothetical protein